jgi:hypothetical protein
MTEIPPSTTQAAAKRTTSTLSDTGDPGGPDKRRWTVMIFMGAGHVDGVTAPLDEYAREDIAEIRKAVTGNPPDSSVNVFVELHANGKSGREWVGHDKGLQPIAPDAGDGNALTSFIQWCRKTAQHEPGDRSMLVMWGHAFQFAIGARRTPTGIDALDFAELAQVLKTLQASDSKSEAVTDGHAARCVDIIAFDACDISTVEIANLLHPYARYLVSSQIGVPLPGWPYHTILDQLIKAQSSRAPMRPTSLGSFIVRRFCEEYHRAETETSRYAVSLTMLDLNRAADIYQAAEWLAEGLARAGGEDDSELQRIAAQFFNAQTMDGHPFIDVADFCLNVARYCTEDQLRIAAARLGDMLIRPRSLAGVTYGPFVLEHGRNSHLTAKLHGVSLYAPQIANGRDWRDTRFWYDKLGNDQGASVWSRVIHVLAEGM